MFLIFFFENIFEIFFWKFFLENFVLKFFFWNFFLIFFFLEKGRYRPSDLDCMRRQDSENIAHWRVIQLFSRRLCVCHCLCIRLCLCICVPNSFLNSYYHKLSENVWVWGCGVSRSEIWWDVTMAGRTDKQKRKDRATQPFDHGRLRWAIWLKYKTYMFHKSLYLTDKQWFCSLWKEIGNILLENIPGMYIYFGIRYHILYNIDIVQEAKNVKLRMFILEYSFFVRGDWDTCRNISCSRSRLWVELNPLSLIHADSDSYRKFKFSKIFYRLVT